MKASRLLSSSKRLKEKQEQERLCLRVGVIKTGPVTDAYRDGWERTFGAKSERAKRERALERRLDGAMRRIADNAQAAGRRFFRGA
jgi:hypothetical protein